MSSWTAGYVADINYTYGFYRELTPAILAFVALAKGQAGPDLSAPLTYCELGCGQGVSANLLAAANPNIEFHANDFNPAQIAFANALAREGGAPNVHFSDASFQEYIADESLPQFDIIALHGIYSWVSAENRQAIVDFIRRKLKVGGLVYISFNTLPGWSTGMPMRRLFIDHAGTTGGPLASRIEKALAFTERMIEANGAYFRDVAGAAKRFEGVRTQNRSYLAHEYFNRDWTPLYFADTAAELGEAKLSYLGSAHLLDHIDAVNFTPQHKAILDEAADPVFKETVRDYLTLQQFRRDVFVRGGLSLNPGQIQDAWLDLRLALGAPRAKIKLKATGPLGEVSLNEGAYIPVLDALAGGPKTVRQLVQDPVIAGFGWARLQEVVKVLVGQGTVQPCLDAKGDGKRAQRTRAINLAILKRAVWSADIGFLASPVTGGAVPLDRIQQLLLTAILEKRTDPAAQVWSVLQTQGQKLVKDGKPIEADEDNVAELAERLAVFQADYLPVLQQLGVA